MSDIFIATLNVGNSYYIRTSHYFNIHIVNTFFIYVVTYTSGEFGPDMTGLILEMIKLNIAQHPFKCMFCAF